MMHHKNMLFFGSKFVDFEDKVCRCGERTATGKKQKVCGDYLNKRSYCCYDSIWRCTLANKASVNELPCHKLLVSGGV